MSIKYHTAIYNKSTIQYIIKCIENSSISFEIESDNELSIVSEFNIFNINQLKNILIFNIDKFGKYKKIKSFLIDYFSGNENKYSKKNQIIGQPLSPFEIDYIKSYIIEFEKLKYEKIKKINDAYEENTNSFDYKKLNNTIDSANNEFDIKTTELINLYNLDILNKSFQLNKKSLFEYKNHKNTTKL